MPNSMPLRNGFLLGLISINEGSLRWIFPKFTGEPAFHKARVVQDIVFYKISL